MKKIYLIVAAGLVVLGFTSLYLISCSSSGSSSSAGAPGFSTGVITAKGSIFVNGVEYHTDSSSISKDGTSGHSDADLHVGMVVSVSGRIHDDDSTGEGSEVEYEDNLQGPLTAMTGTMFPATLTVLDQSVIVDANTHLRSSSTNTDMTISALHALLGNAPIIEVSGMTDATGAIQATFIELEEPSPGPGDGIEIKGVISAGTLNTGANTFQINALIVDYSSAQMKEFPAGGIAEGQSVEAKSTRGQYDSATHTMIAAEIEYKTHRTPREGDRAEVEGYVSNYDAGAKTFTVRGISVNASGIAIPAGLANGSIVEVHGAYAGGVLTATRIELRTRL